MDWVHGVWHVLPPEVQQTVAALSGLTPLCTVFAQEILWKALAPGYGGKESPGPRGKEALVPGSKGARLVKKIILPDKINLINIRMETKNNIKTKNNIRKIYSYFS